MPLLPEKWQPGEPIPAWVIQQLCRWAQNHRPNHPALTVQYTPEAILHGLKPEMLWPDLAWPFLATLTGSGQVAVRSGRVLHQFGEVTAAALSAWTPSGDEYVYLELYYPNDDVANCTAELKRDSSVPASEYTVDVVPYVDDVGGTPQTVPDAGSVTMRLPVAFVDFSAKAFTQYVIGDVFVPYGKTYQRRVVVGFRDDGTDLYQVYVTETYVAGVLASVSDPLGAVLIAGKPCPTS